MSNNPITTTIELNDYIKMDYDYSSKIIIVGDQDSGKTTLIQRALNPSNHNNNEAYQPTQGFEHFNLVVEHNNKKIKMTIWDTCGQEVYRAILSSFYRGADIALLVFSLSSKPSFLSLNKWIIDLKTNLNPGTPIILVGTKLDLLKEQVVDNNEINNFITTNELTHFYFTTTQNDSCSLVFKEVAKTLLDVIESPGRSKRDSIRLSVKSFKKKKKKCC